MEIRAVLEKFGLKGKKTDIYLAVLELGGGSVIEIAKKTEIKRTTCYNVILDLIEQGLILQTIRNGRNIFIGESPEKILREMKNKERLFLEILPSLQSIQKYSPNKPKIKYYESKEGLREIYEDTIKSGGKEILGFFSYDVVNVLGKEWADDYVKKRIKKGIYARAISPREKKLLEDYIENDREQRRSTKIIDAGEFPFSIEINIYGEQKVALISAKEEIGLIIEGSEIHKTMKLIFELIWKLLPEIKIKERYSPVIKEEE